MQLSRRRFSINKQSGIFPVTNKYVEILNNVDVFAYHIIAWICTGLQEASDLGFIFGFVIKYSWACHILVGI